MTAQNQIPFPALQFFDNNGAPLVGGNVYTYANDGVTPKATYTEPTGTLLNTNPIVLDSAGRAVIWGTGKYVFAIQDSLGNPIVTNYTYDPTALLNVSAAMLPVIQAPTTAQALALLGGTSIAATFVPGMIIATASGSTPAFWLLCSGQAVSRVTYSSLFALLGTTYGAGDGSTTFNVPDLRGRMVAGQDFGAGRLTTASLGTTAVLGVGGGSELLTSHTHGVSDPGHSHSIIGSIWNASGPTISTTGETAGAIPVVNNPSTQVNVTGVTVQASGGGASQNIPPVLVLNYIIFAGV